MGKQDTTTSKVNELRPLLDGVAKNLVGRLYGPDGLPWGTPLSELEDVAVAIRTLLAERLMHHALARQADSPPPPPLQRCPTCHGPLDRVEAEQRLVHTRAGDAHWEEPQAYCPCCRKAFFPSVPQPRTGPHRV